MELSSAAGTNRKSSARVPFSLRISPRGVFPLRFRSCENKKSSMFRRYPCVDDVLSASLDDHTVRKVASFAQLHDGSLSLALSSLQCRCLLKSFSSLNKYIVENLNLRITESLNPYPMNIRMHPVHISSRLSRISLQNSQKYLKKCIHFTNDVDITITEF